MLTEDVATKYFEDGFRQLLFQMSEAVYVSKVCFIHDMINLRNT